MAGFEFDINSLFQRAFGTGRGKPFDPSKVEDNEVKTEPPFTDLPTLNGDEGDFGTMRDILGSNMPDGRPVFMPVQIGDLLLPNEPSLSISFGKNIVSTPIVGSNRKGKVKELIGIEDIRITIRGIALTYDNPYVYPEGDVKAIYDLFQIPEALDIKCGLTSLLGIYRVVITGGTFPDMIGIQHAQAYELQCEVDEEFELEIT